LVEPVDVVEGGGQYHWCQSPCVRQAHRVPEIVTILGSAGAATELVTWPKLPRRQYPRGAALFRPPVSYAPVRSSNRSGTATGLAAMDVRRG